MSGLAVAVVVGCGRAPETPTNLPSSASAPPPPVIRPLGPPTITQVSPTFGGAGVLVSIIGTNFIGGVPLLESVTTVQFAGGSASALFSIVSDTVLIATVPSGAKNGLISVSVPGKTVAQSPLPAFEAEPVVVGITPNLARPGVTAMTVIGRNLCSASHVRFNGTASPVTGSTTCTKSDLAVVTALLPASVAGPVTLVSVVTPSGTGTALSAPTQTSLGRVAVLTSYASGFGGPLTIAPRDIQAAGSAVYFTDPDRFRFFRVNPADGIFLASAGATIRPIWVAAITIAALNSVGVVVSDAPVAAQRLASQVFWTPAFEGGQGPLLAIRASDGSVLRSLVVGPGPILAVGVNENASGTLNSVWYTTLTSIGVVDKPLTALVLRSFTLSDLFVLDGGVPAGLAFTPLGSVVIAAGTTVAFLTSTGSPAGTFNLSAMAAFGGAAPLVSSVAFDPTTAGAGTLWYADAGQHLIVRCASGACATSGSLTSFALVPLGGTRPRVVAVDYLGSVWFDEPNALERLSP